MKHENTANVYVTLKPATIAAIRKRVALAPDLSTSSRAAYMINGTVTPPKRYTAAKRVRVRPRMDGMPSVTDVGQKIVINGNGYCCTINKKRAAIDTDGLTDNERRLYAAHMQRKASRAMDVGHAPKVTRKLCLASSCPSLLETSIKAARAALKVAARGNDQKTRLMRMAFERDVRSMLDSGITGYVLSDGADFIHVAALAFDECGAFDKASGAVSPSLVVGMDSKGNDITAFVYALRACHKHLYSNRAVRGRSAKAVYLDAQEGNTDAIVCAAGLCENSISQWEGEEHVNEILREVAEMCGDKRAKIALYLYQGYSHKEIAEKLKMSRQGVEKHISALKDVFPKLRYA